MYINLFIWKKGDCSVTPLHIMEYLARHEACKDAGLRRFMGKPSDSGEVSCPFRGCSVVCSYAGQMRDHQTTVKHPRWNKNMPPLDISTCHCETCGKDFFNWGVLYKHLNTHSKPFQCQECPYQVASMGRLRKHCTSMHGIDLPRATHWQKKEE